MHIKGLKKLKRLCDRIGLENIGDLITFYNENAEHGESIITVLERYIASFPKYQRFKK